jgi:predicted metal-dependent phosphoesterase TrpH
VVDDFVAVSTTVAVPSILSLHPSVPARSLKELIDLAKAKPGTVFAASSGNGAFSHLLLEMLNTRAGIKLSHVPFKGEAPAVQHLLSNQDAMRSALLELQAGRVARAVRIVEVLNRHSIPVTMDAVLAEANGGAIGRPHVARAMVAGGWVRDFREAFDRWIGFGRPAYMAKERFDVADAIALVHEAGGLAAWAHPGDSATPTRIQRLADMGLDSVEVLHPSHQPSLSQRLFDNTEKAGLLPSGGSDWHGTHDGPRRLGGQLVPKIWLDWQEVRVAERAARGRDGLDAAKTV